jgi:hypothetical protein
MGSKGSQENLQKQPAVQPVSFDPRNLTKPPQAVIKTIAISLLKPVVVGKLSESFADLLTSHSNALKCW